jgi:hypothetical protein
MPQLRKKWRFSEEYPEGNQSPAHQDHLTLARVTIQADHGLKGLPRYVVGLAEVRDRGPVHMEVLSDPLLI